MNDNVPQRERDIPAALQSLVNQIERCEKISSGVLTQIGSVLRPVVTQGPLLTEEPVPISNKAVPQPVCGMAKRLQEITARLCKVVDLMQNIESRIEL